MSTDLLVLPIMYLLVVDVASAMLYVAKYFPQVLDALFHVFSPKLVVQTQTVSMPVRGNTRRSHHIAERVRFHN